MPAGLPQTEKSDWRESLPGHRRPGQAAFQHFLRKADESTLGRLLVELAILHAATSPNESSKALREAAEFYKVDVEAITTKVKQEFAAKDKAKAVKTASGRKPAAKDAKKSIAA